MSTFFNRLGSVVTGLCVLATTALPASAHPGLHPAADHSHHFAGFEFAAVAVVAASAVIVVYRRRTRG